MHRIPASVLARIERLKAYFETHGGASHPSFVTPPPDDQPVDDGSEYGDPFEDRRPDFVKEAMRGWVPIPEWDHHPFMAPGERDE